MSRSNLAFALETQDALEAQAANSLSLERLLGANRVTAAVKAPQRQAGARKLPFNPRFQDNSSGDFRPFRVY